MALPVALVLLHLPADLVLHLHVATGVLVGVPTVLQNIPALTNRIEFSDLNVSLN